MNIILFTTVNGRPGSLNLSRPQIYLPVFAIMATISCLLIYSGYRLGAGAAQTPPTVALDDWRSDMEDQRRAVDAAKRSSQAHLDALALRLAQIQAQVLRLDALGERLIDATQLDKGEFDFKQVPALGGPAQALEQASLEPPEFMRELETLSAQIDDRERQLSVLEDLLMDRTLSEQGYPSGRPVASGWLSSHFGKRTDPFTGRPALHQGVDFAGKMGTEIVAAAAGVVTWSGKRYGYGNLVEINHGNGYVTRYGHNKKNLVKVGETVKKGQKIALMGSSGRSTGPHVHYEVLRNGRQVDPARHLATR